MKFLFENGDQNVNTDGNPDLSFDRVFGCAIEGFDSQWKKLDRHGSGILHHICYIVDYLEEAWKYFKEKGLRSVTGKPRSTCTLEKAMFLLPKDAGNVVIEFVTRAVCLPPG
jgi:hypothetical protein